MATLSLKHSFSPLTCFLVLAPIETQFPHSLAAHTYTR